MNKKSNFNKWWWEYIVQRCGSVNNTVASQQEGPGFESPNSVQGLHVQTQKTEDMHA